MAQIDRRWFMTKLAAAAGLSPAVSASRLFGAGVDQAAPPPPSNPRIVSTQRVLTMADLTWLGTFKSPAALNLAGGSVVYPRFTLRRVGNVLKTLWLVGAGPGPSSNALIQADYPGYDPALLNSPEASGNLRNFGNGYLPLTVSPDGSPLSQAYVEGIHWDDHNQCVWIVYADIYNVVHALNPVLIRGDINDAAPDATAVTWSGPWRLSGNAPNSTAQPVPNQTAMYTVSVPAAYGAAHLNGATIALGAHGFSGDLVSPFNNTLWAPAVTPTPATPTTPKGGADLPARCLIGGDIDPNHRGRRPGDYTTVPCGSVGQGSQDPTSFTRSALTGWFTAMDGVGSAVWLDWDTIKGVLFLVKHGRGHLWYNSKGLQGGIGHCNHGVNDRYQTTGPESVVPLGNDSSVFPYSSSLLSGRNLPYESGPDIEAALYSYDPDTFVPVAGGNIWSVPVKDWSYLLDKFPNFAVSKDIGSWVGINPNGMAADQTSRLIMIPCAYVTGGGINGSGFYCNVFRVAP